MSIAQSSQALSAGWVHPGLGLRRTLREAPDHDALRRDAALHLCRDQGIDIPAGTCLV